MKLIFILILEFTWKLHVLSRTPKKTKQLSASCLNSKNISLNTNIDEFLTRKFQNYIFDDIENSILENSGWSYRDVAFADLCISKCDPFRVGSKTVELPNNIANRKAIINIKNEDEFCFLYCVALHLFRQKFITPYEPSTIKEYFKHFNISVLTFPLSINDIEKFCELNIKFELSFSVILVVFQGSGYYVSNNISTGIKRNKNHINLVLCEKGKKSHFFYIINLTRLVTRQISKHHGKVFLCYQCFAHYSSQKFFTILHISSSKQLTTQDVESFFQYYDIWNALIKRVQENSHCRQLDFKFFLTFLKYLCRYTIKPCRFAFLEWSGKIF